MKHILPIILILVLILVLTACVSNKKDQTSSAETTYTQIDQETAVEMMGKDDTPDLLLLHFSLERESAVTDCIQGKDEEDIHQALNQYTGFLIEQLQKRVGKENV